MTLRTPLYSKLAFVSGMVFYERDWLSGEAEDRSRRYAQNPCNTHIHGLRVCLCALLLWADFLRDICFASLCLAFATLCTYDSRVVPYETCWVQKQAKHSTHTRAPGVSGQSVLFFYSLGRGCHLRLPYPLRFYMLSLSLFVLFPEKWRSVGEYYLPGPETAKKKRHLLASPSSQKP